MSPSSRLLLPPTFLPHRRRRRRLHWFSLHGFESYPWFRFVSTHSYSYQVCPTSSSDYVWRFILFVSFFFLNSVFFFFMIGIMKDLIWCCSVGVRRRSWHLGYSNRSSPILSSQEIKSQKAVTQFLFILPLLTLLGSPNPLLIGIFRNSDFELLCRNWFVKDLERCGCFLLTWLAVMCCWFGFAGLWDSWTRLRL